MSTKKKGKGKFFKKRSAVNLDEKAIHRAHEMRVAGRDWADIARHFDVTRDSMIYRVRNYQGTRLEEEERGAMEHSAAALAALEELERANNAIYTLDQIVRYDYYKNLEGNSELGPDLPPSVSEIIRASSTMLRWVTFRAKVQGLFKAEQLEIVHSGTINHVHDTDAIVSVLTALPADAFDQLRALEPVLAATAAEVEQSASAETLN